MVEEFKVIEGLYYTKEHEWVRIVSDKRAVVGITDYAVKMLRDIVYVSLPEVGSTVKSGEVLGSVESVKAVSDVYAPLSGVVVKVNDKLSSIPELISESPYGDGWIAEIEPLNLEEVKSLYTAVAYAAYLKELGRKEGR
ncbi:MAG: glycine cleavage system protein GcvH [Nitrososphaerales archaeon]